MLQRSPYLQATRPIRLGGNAIGWNKQRKCGAPIGVTNGNVLRRGGTNDIVVVTSKVMVVSWDGMEKSWPEVLAYAIHNFSIHVRGLYE